MNCNKIYIYGLGFYLNLLLLCIPMIVFKFLYNQYYSHFHLGLSLLVFVSFAVIKYHDLRNFGKEGFILVYTSTAQFITE